MSEIMPAEVAKIINAAIDHAYGRCALPENIDELYNWLIWESGDEALDNYEFFFSLNDIDLSDIGLIDDTEVADKLSINDDTRINYAREKIAHNVADMSEELHAAHAFELKNDKGEAIFMCCTTQTHGQSGPHATWEGFFSSREAYYEYQINVLARHYADRLDKITDEEILAAWQRR